MRIYNPVSTHGGLSGIGVNDHHNEAHALSAAVHTGEGTDAQHGVRALANAHGFAQLSGALSDAQHGVLTIANAHGFAQISGALSDAQHGVRTLANAHPHIDLSGVTPDQHHAQSHISRHRVGGADPLRHVDILRLGG